MQSIKKVIGYTSTVYGLEKVSKRAWAEYFEMENKLARYKFVVKLYHTLFLGLLIGIIFDKLM